MPYKAPAYVTAYNWTGFYIGAHAGYGWAQFRRLRCARRLYRRPARLQLAGQGSPWVFGVEVDSAWADLGRSSTFFVPAGLLSVSSNANYQGSLRGRVGYAFDRTMIYATGGLGWINNEVTVNAAVGPFAVGLNESQMHIGGVVGAGIEHAIAPNWSVKAEYLYAMYGSERYFGAIAGGISGDIDTHTVKVGLTITSADSGRLQATQPGLTPRLFL